MIEPSYMFIPEFMKHSYGIRIDSLYIKKNLCFATPLLNLDVQNSTKSCTIIDISMLLIGISFSRVPWNLAGFTILKVFLLRLKWKLPSFMKFLYISYQSFLVIISMKSSSISDMSKIFNSSKITPFHLWGALGCA